MKGKKPEADVSLEEEIHHYYTHDQLDEIYRRFLADFLKTIPAYFDVWNLDYKEFEGLTIRKRELVRLLAITLSDVTIFTTWFSRIPYLVARVLETLVWEGKQPLEALNARTKGDLLSPSSTHKNDIAVINPDYCLFLQTSFPHWQADGSAVSGLDLPATVRKACKRFLPKPKGYILKPLKPPEDTACYFADREAILRALGIIQEFVGHGKLESTKSGSPSKQSLSRLSQQSGLTEFYPESAESTLKLLRIELISHLFIQPLSFKTAISSHESLKYLFTQFAELQEPTLVRFLEHVKGWYHAEKLLHKNHQQVLLELMKHLPPEKWIAVKQLLRFALVRDIDLCPIDHEAYRYLYTTSDWKGWGHTKHPVYEQFNAEIIVEPYLKAALFFFAAFGLLDIHYDLPRAAIELGEAHHYFSAFDGLQYLRLTPLGTYVLGLNDGFEPQQQQQEQTTLHLDEERLLITLSRSDDRIETILAKLATRIGRTRFRCDYLTLLQDCTTGKDVESKVELLVGLAGPDLPQNWKRFIDQITKNSRTLIPSDDYHVYKVDPQDNALLELFSQDKELRELVRFAEEYHLLVLKKDLAQLKKRLLIFGYLF